MEVSRTTCKERHAEEGGRHAMRAGEGLRPAREGQDLHVLFEVYAQECLRPSGLLFSMSRLLFYMSMSPLKLWPIWLMFSVCLQLYQHSRTHLFIHTCTNTRIPEMRTFIRDAHDRMRANFRFLVLFNFSCPSPSFHFPAAPHTPTEIPTSLYYYRG